MKEFIEKLKKKENLNFEESKNAFENLMNGKAADDDIFNLGKKISNRSLVDRVKTIFENSYSASFIGEPETSDLKMIINIQTERRRERLGENFPFIVYGNGGINLVRTEDNSEIKVIQLHEKKGSDFNSENLAGLDAIDKIEKDLEEILGQLGH